MQEKKSLNKKIKSIAKSLSGFIEIKQTLKLAKNVPSLPKVPERKNKKIAADKIKFKVKKALATEDTESTEKAREMECYWSWSFSVFSVCSVVQGVVSVL